MENVVQKFFHQITVGSVCVPHPFAPGIRPPDFRKNVHHLHAGVHFHGWKNVSPDLPFRRSDPLRDSSFRLFRRIVSQHQRGEELEERRKHLLDGIFLGIVVKVFRNLIHLQHVFFSDGVLKFENIEVFGDPDVGGDEV